MEELILRMFQVAAFGLRHADYNHTIAKAKLYDQLVGGRDLDSLLKQYVRREDKNLFQQRVKLTQHIVTAVCDNLLDVFYKVPRSNSARRVHTYTGTSTDIDNRVEQLEGVLNKFYGAESFEDYMATRFIQLGSLDPNAFVVFEWDDFDGAVERISPRPFEVSSTMAVDYKKTNNTLDYLIVKDSVSYTVIKTPSNPISTELVNPKDLRKTGERYTLYSNNQVVKIEQVDEKSIRGNTAPIQKGKVFIANGKDYVQIGEKLFRYFVATPHNLGIVNILQPGYLRDPQTNGRTYVNQLHRIEPYLLKTIKVNSEFDLVATLLAFPQLLKYGRPCKADDCYEGICTDGSSCLTCGGSGIEKTAFSAQDSITIKMPNSKEEMIPLDSLMTYISPPVDVIQWQQDYIESITVKCKELLHNTETFTKKEVANTATAKNLDMQNIYDTLYPFSIMYARAVTKGVHIIAKLADLDKDLVFITTFGKDFKMKSLDTLVIDLSVANNIGNQPLVQHLNKDIAQIIFADDPMQLQRYLVKETFSPFSGKSDAEVMLLMNSTYVREEEKILHANMSRIFDELELDIGTTGKNFYKLKRNKQKEAIMAKVKEIQEAIKAAQPDPELDLQ